MTPRRHHRVIRGADLGVRPTARGPGRNGRQARQLGSRTTSKPGHGSSHKLRQSAAIHSPPARLVCRQSHRRGVIGRASRQFGTRLQLPSSPSAGVDEEGSARTLGTGTSAPSGRNRSSSAPHERVFSTQQRRGPSARVSFEPGSGGVKRNWTKPKLDLHAQPRKAQRTCSVRIQLLNR